jgi:hypothetical protein
MPLHEYVFSQFVYLRDNKLANLAGIEILKRVKVRNLMPALCISRKQLVSVQRTITCLIDMAVFDDRFWISVLMNSKGLVSSLYQTVKPSRLTLVFFCFPNNAGFHGMDLIG